MHFNGYEAGTGTFSGRQNRQILQHKVMPLVSVIIPTYNRASYLKEAVQSVLGQTFQDFELIVVDDGSTDSTPSVLQVFADVITYIYQENKGVSSARNTGLERAAGSLIALLDSDDLWDPQKLEVQTRFFRSRPEALICQTQEIWIRNGRRVNPKAYHRKQAGDVFGISLQRCMVSPSAVMFRKRLLDEVGLFDTRLPACEDYDLWLRVSCRHPVHLIPQALTIKRGGHSDQLSTTVPALDGLRIEALCKILNQGILTPLQKKQTLQALTIKARIYLQGCIKRNRHREINRIKNMLRYYEIEI